ncbi:hypothetical protein BSKO_03660 [Bryopsis sp. KO-2023]|nr:hypothetical protein BSKO_03660 [Bryopsis sp. KO-2023]
MLHQGEGNHSHDSNQPPATADTGIDLFAQLALMEERCLAFEQGAEAYAHQVEDLEHEVSELSGQLQTVQDDLYKESARNRELVAEISKQNSNIIALEEDIQELQDTVDKKEDIIGNLEDYLVAERRQREDTEEEFESRLRAKDAELREMHRSHESDRRRLIMQTEEQIRVGQGIAHMMDEERRMFRDEKEMLESELHGQQQTVRELQEVLNCVPGNTDKLMELELKVRALHAENVQLKQNAGTREMGSAVAYARSSNNNEVGEGDENSPEELRKQLEEAIRNHDWLAKEFEEYRGKHEALEFEYDTRVATLQMALGSKAATEGHVKSLTSQQQRLQSDLDNARARCNGMESHILELRGHLKSSEFEIAELKASNETKDEKLLARERDIVRLERENHHMMEQLQKLRAAGGLQSSGALVPAELREKIVELRSSLKDSREHLAILGSHNQNQFGKASRALGVAVRHTDGMLCLLGMDPSEGSSDDDEVYEERMREVHKPPRCAYMSPVHLGDVEEELRTILTTARVSLGHNNPKQRIQYHLRLKQEMEEMRRECVGLLRERFQLEQCVRYLAVRSHTYPKMCVPHDVSGQHQRGPSDLISPKSLASTVHYSTPTGRRILLRGSRGSSTMGQDLSPYKARGLMEAKIRQVQNDTVREVRDLLQDVCQDRSYNASLKQRNHAIERRILSKVSTVCEAYIDPCMEDDETLLQKHMGASSNKRMEPIVENR